MKKHWRILVGIATWILTVVGTFLVAPAYASTGAWENFGRFVVAILAGLVILGFKAAGQREHAWIWISLCVVTFLLGGWAWISYTKNVDALTVPYGGSRLVIGTHKDAGAARYQVENGFTDQQLVMEYAGATSRIWPEAEINANRFRFCLLYLASLAAFSVAMMTLVKTLECVAGKSP
jgi:hypothetical protein